MKKKKVVSLQKSLSSLQNPLKFSLIFAFAEFEFTSEKFSILFLIDFKVEQILISNFVRQTDMVTFLPVHLKSYH
jgi:hypothetical protein